jgi:hypothetical protein
MLILAYENQQMKMVRHQTVSNDTAKWTNLIGNLSFKEQIILLSRKNRLLVVPPIEDMIKILWLKSHASI